MIETPTNDLQSIADALAGRCIKGFILIPFDSCTEREDWILLEDNTGVLLENNTNTLFE